MRKNLKIDTIFSLVLLLLSVGTIISLSSDLKSSIVNTEEKGAILSQEFIIQIVVSSVLAMISFAVFLYYKMKKEKLESLFIFILIILLLTFLFNNVILGASMGLLIFTEVLDFSFQLFNIFAFSFIVFILGFFVFTNQIIQIFKMGESLTKYSFKLGVKKSATHLVPIILMLLSLIFVMNSNSQMITCVLISSLFASVYSSNIVAVQLSRFKDKF
ncbi:hypothetical protein ACFLY9_02490 [Patescibacteria group bacterium]